MIRRWRTLALAMAAVLWVSAVAAAGSPSNAGQGRPAQAAAKAQQHKGEGRSQTPKPRLLTGVLVPLGGGYAVLRDTARAVRVEVTTVSDANYGVTGAAYGVDLAAHVGRIVWLRGSFGADRFTVTEVKASKPLSYRPVRGKGTRSLPGVLVQLGDHYALVHGRHATRVAAATTVTQENYAPAVDLSRYVGHFVVVRGRWNVQTQQFEVQAVKKVRPLRWYGAPARSGTSGARERDD